MRRCGAADGRGIHSVRPLLRGIAGCYAVRSRLILCRGHRAAAQRCRRAGATLAASHGDHAALEVDISQGRSMSSPARIPVSDISRTIASSRRSRKSLPPQALISRRSSSSVREATTLASSLGALSPSGRRRQSRPLPQATRRTAARRASGRARWPAPRHRQASRRRKPLTRSRSTAGEWPCSAHQRRNAPTPSP